MALDATARRRWFGSLMLLAALAMLVGGETILKDRLSPLAFLFYWFVCFALAGLAIFTAYLDMRALQRRSRQEQRDLLDATLKDIEKDAKGKRQT
jgi:4-hydroxybenzoate polyprenyltransferase